MVPISIRMKAIADMVPDGYSVADIGCDHGFVALYLVTQKQAPKAVAMDINEGPLIRAKEHIKQYGLTDVIDTRLSDGAVKLQSGEVDCAIIAGMGGKLTIKILTDSYEKFRSMKCFVLSPHSDIPQVREYLYSNGFEICDEDMVFDEGKYYTIMRCAKAKETLKNGVGGAAAFEAYGKQDISQADIAFGPKLIEKKHPVLKDYLEAEIPKQQEIKRKLESSLNSSKESKKEAINQRIEEVNSRIEIVNKVMSQM